MNQPIGEQPNENVVVANGGILLLDRILESIGSLFSSRTREEKPKMSEKVLVKFRTS